MSLGSYSLAGGHQPPTGKANNKGPAVAVCGCIRRILRLQSWDYFWSSRGYYTSLVKIPQMWDEGGRGGELGRSWTNSMGISICIEQLTPRRYNYSFLFRKHFPSRQDKYKTSSAEITVWSVLAGSVFAGPLLLTTVSLFFHPASLMCSAVSSTRASFIYCWYSKLSTTTFSVNFTEICTDMTKRWWWWWWWQNATGNDDDDDDDDKLLLVRCIRGKVPWDTDKIDIL